MHICPHVQLAGHVQLRMLPGEEHLCVPTAENRRPCGAASVTATFAAARTRGAIWGIAMTNAELQEIQAWVSHAHDLLIQMEEALESIMEDYFGSTARIFTITSPTRLMTTVQLGELARSFSLLKAECISSALTIGTPTQRPGQLAELRRMLFNQWRA